MQFVPKMSKYNVARLCFLTTARVVNIVLLRGLLS